MTHSSGSPAATLNSPLLPPRFWAKVELQADGCWLWIAARTTTGYGTYTVEGATRRAHRVSYEVLIGEIPVGLVLDHLCRVRACVNPQHLEPVTHQVNLLRGETSAARNAARTHCNYGHPFDEANTGSDGGKRRCRACNRARWRRAVARRQGAA